MAKIAIYPGTFDPITNGHSDLLMRAACMFDKVVLAIADNPEKSPLFSLDERICLAKAVLNDSGINSHNIDVVGFPSLLINFARDCHADVIIRGLRAVSDFEYEFQLASMNRKLDSTIETVFLTPSENHTFVSASMVKEIARYGGNVSQFVHQTVFDALVEKFSAE